MAIDPSQWTQEEVVMALQDVLTDCGAGRTEGHRCPCEEQAALQCENEDGWVKVDCTRCRLSFEGLLG